MCSFGVVEVLNEISGRLLIDCGRAKGRCVRQRCVEMREPLTATLLTAASSQACGPLGDALGAALSSCFIVADLAKRLAVLAAPCVRYPVVAGEEQNPRPRKAAPGLHRDVETGVTDLLDVLGKAYI